MYFVAYKSIQSTMKKTVTLLGCFCLTLIFALSSCTPSVSGDDSKDFLEKLKSASETKFDTKKVNNLYSIDIPDFMVSTTDLNDEASLQYNNLYKEKYIIVLDEDKETLIADLKSFDLYDEKRTLIEMFSEAKESFIINEASVIGKISRKSSKINGMSASITEFDSNVAGIPEAVTYYLAFVEGKDNLYTIMAWTLTSRKADFKDEAMKMIKSFREQ